jgi:hypothetical protein
VLDSGASRIRLATDPASASFTAIDNGSGMRRRELARYHDVAASTKGRGDGIGFAGVGIKLDDRVLAISSFTTAARLAGSIFAAEKPCPDPLPNLPRRHSGADLFNTPDDLVTWNAGEGQAGPLPFHGCCIRVTHTAGLNADTHLSRTRLSDRTLHNSKRAWR